MTNYVAKINKETNLIEGYYVEGIHGKEMCEKILHDGGLLLSEELWQELLTYGQAEVNLEALAGMPITLENDGEEHVCLGIECSSCFEQYVAPQEPQEPQPPTQVELLETKVVGLEGKIDELTSQMSTLIATLSAK